MEVNFQLENFETFARLKNLCRSLIQDSKNVKCLSELRDLVLQSPESFIRVVQSTVLSTFYPIFKCISEDRTSYKDNDKEIIVNILTNIFEKSVTEKLGLFFNIYAFLLFEIYDHINHTVLSISEEYKLSIIKCCTALVKSISSDLLFELYTKLHAPKLCQMLYVAIEIAKNEKLRSLRVTSIECIMAMARVLDDHDLDDLVIQNQVAEVFMFFLPGIATNLKQIALEDEKVGHMVSKVAVKAWGRIITLLMRDYNSSGVSLVFPINNSPDTQEYTASKAKLRTKEGMNEYIENTKRSKQWYNETDRKLQHLVIQFSKLTHHSHPSVRMELTDMCFLVISNCLITLPTTVCHLIEIVIILSEDDIEEIRVKNLKTLDYLAEQLPCDNLKTLLENLEEGFYSGVYCLPRKFNGIDEKEHLASLNLLIGYIKLFGKHKLGHVLMSGNYLRKLMETLLYISELRNGDLGLMEEYSIKDFTVGPDLVRKWKNFQLFREERVRSALEKLCRLLGQNETFPMVCDYLLDEVLHQSPHKKEAIFLLNEVMAGCEYNGENLQILTNIKNSYLENSLWQVPVEISTDEFGDELTLNQVQNNVIQVCLLVEGIGRLSGYLQSEKFLLDTLYLILEKAGSSHDLVRSAGLLALQEVTNSFGCDNVTLLINKYIDYFTFFAERKLKRMENIPEVLGVLEVVMKYTKLDILPYIADIISEVLLHSCDKFKEKYATNFLKIFKSFIQCVLKWFQIEKCVKPIKSRKEKQKEIEDFQVSGIEEVEDFSDDIMGKSAEELFQEDMAKKQEELEKEVEEPEVEGYNKPEPPLQVKLSVAIITRSLQFLPSKNQTRKLLSLEILLNGLEIIRDWEDELLPLVHQIWSPLVERFKEVENPLIINYSFQLLVTLARVSKEFIRMRTSKEVLPNIVNIMIKLANESYLKDKGSAYRYSQSFKLQLTVLSNLGNVIVDLDIQNKHTSDILRMVYKYLSDKQPIPLQNAALDCLRILSIYDLEFIKGHLEKWEENQEGGEFKKNISHFKTITDELEHLM